ncbi:hypothetical protein ACFLU6_12905, partial [Acidobacteriota bacterium]
LGHEALVHVTVPATMVDSEQDLSAAVKGRVDTTGEPTAHLTARLEPSSEYRPGVAVSLGIDISRWHLFTLEGKAIF